MIVGELAIHEAGHGVIDLATGGTATCLRIGKQEGLASTRSVTTLARLMVLVAGDVATEEIRTFELPDAPVQAPPAPHVPAEVGTIVELAALWQKGETGFSVPTDQEQFLTEVARLIAEKKIKDRRAVRSRYWIRCRDRVRRMLHWSGPHRRHVRIVAKALQREGALFGGKIREIIESDSGPALKVSGRLLDRITSKGLVPCIGSEAAGGLGEETPGPSSTEEEP